MRFPIFALHLIWDGKIYVYGVSGAKEEDGEKKSVKWKIYHTVIQL